MGKDLVTGRTLSTEERLIMMGTMGIASLIKPVYKSIKAGRAAVAKEGDVLVKGVGNTLDSRLVKNEYFNNLERIATRKQIRNYIKEMKSKGTDVIVDKKGKILNGNLAAGFDFSTGKIYIRNKPGVIDLYHEGYHAEQFMDIGKDTYIGFGPLAREEYVYSRILENSNLFNEAELKGAFKYISQLRNGF
jgi:hypothetical protein